MKLGEQLEGLLRQAKFGELVSSYLGGFRDIDESDEQTLKRVMSMLQRWVCPHCRGLCVRDQYGHARRFECRHCDSTGLYREHVIKLDPPKLVKDGT